MEKLPKPTGQKSWLEYYRSLKKVHPLINSQWKCVVGMQREPKGFYQAPEFRREMSFYEVEQQVLLECTEKLDLVEELLLKAFPAFANFMASMELQYLLVEDRAAFNKVWGYMLELERIRKP